METIKKLDEWFNESGEVVFVRELVYVENLFGNGKENYRNYNVMGLDYYNKAYDPMFSFPVISEENFKELSEKIYESKVVKSGYCLYPYDLNFETMEMKSNYTNEIDKFDNLNDFLRTAFVCYCENQIISKIPDFIETTFDYIRENKPERLYKTKLGWFWQSWQFNFSSEGYSYFHKTRFSIEDNKVIEHLEDLNSENEKQRLLLLIK